MTYKNREDWLAAAVAELRPLIEAKGHALPEKLRVSTGWPSTKALAKDGMRHTGECWDPLCSADSTTEIFISPYMAKSVDKDDDFDGVLSILLHELIHAAVGVAEGHKGKFKQVALALGFEMPMTQTPVGPELAEVLQSIDEKLGPFPHARLDVSKDKTKKKQSTRMLKCVCRDNECGFTVRMTKKWVEELGVAWCPKHGEMEAVIPPDETLEPISE